MSTPNTYLKPSSVRTPFVLDGSPKDYHATEKIVKRGEVGFVMSQSALKDFAACPHRWINAPAKKETPAMKWGSLLDCMVLTPGRFKERYSITPEKYPDKKTGEEKPWSWNAGHCKEWRANEEAAGFEIADHDDVVLAKQAALVLNEDKLIARFLELSRKQVQLFVEYHDKDTGLVIQLKAMPDLVPPVGTEFGDVIGDFKTTDDAEPRAWMNHCHAMGYHYQAAFYLDAYKAATGLECRQFLHVIQEKNEPFETARRVLSQEFIALGRMRYRQDLAAYCRCLQSGIWPGYDDAHSLIERPPILDGWRLTEPPAWAMAALTD